ncbi:MAG: radical SAM protein [Myxococcota bacterium]
MKLYLIAPRNPESFWTFDRILPSLGKRCVFPNLSLPTVAGLTPDRHEVILCDENVEAIDFGTDADIVGLTGYIVHRKRFLEIAAEFRRRGKFVVAGGPYVSLCPEQVEGKVDVLFVDETEYTWPRFLEEFEEGTWKPVYRQAEKPDMRDSPLPRFDLLKTDRYQTMTVQFARGCPFNCEFCDIIVMYGRKPRSKSPAQILAEFDEIHRLGMKGIFLVDDNFIGNKKLAKEVLRAIIAWQKQRGYPVEINTEVSLNVARDDELLALMRDAGFTTIFVGIETPRKESLLETRKPQNARGDILADIHHIQSFGIQVEAGMIVGFDSDDTKIFDEQFRFIQDARIPVSMTGMLNAMPKTPLHERLKAAGRLISESVGDQFVFTNVIPKAMSRIEFYEGYRNLLERLYDYRNYKRRTLDYILSRGRQVASNVPASRADLAMFCRIMRDCVLKASPRRAWMTLSLLSQTALRRPVAIREAAFFVLVHKHFYEYARHVNARIDQLIDHMKEFPDDLALINPSLVPEKTSP